MNLLQKEFMGMSLMTLLLLIGLLSIWIFFVVIFSIFTRSDGCITRYGKGGNGSTVTGSTVTTTIGLSLRADGNHSDEYGYGQWLDTDIHIEKNSDVTIRVSGKVSLCRAYLPEYNTENDSKKNNSGKLIPIPRVNEVIDSKQKLFADPIVKTGLPLILNNAKYNNSWRNILKIDPLDEVVITLQNERTKEISEAIDIFKSKNLYNDFAYITADCRSDKTEYSPICGKFTVFKEHNIKYKKEKTISYDDLKRVEESSQILRSIKEKEERLEDLRRGLEIEKRLKLDALNKFDVWPIKDQVRQIRKLIKKDEVSDEQEEIAEKLRNSLPWLPEKINKPVNDLIDFIVAQKKYDIKTLKEKIEKEKSKFADEISGWYSARDGAGLVYKIAGNENPDHDLGTNYKFTQKISIPGALKIKESDLGENEKLEKIIKSKLDKNKKPKQEDRTIYQLNNEMDGARYLKMRFFDPYNFGYTGGYVVNIKQTKCIANDGALLKDYDDYKNRGQIKYLITESDDLNKQDIKSRSKTGELIQINNFGEGKFHSANEGTLWLYLDNKPKDYENSFGEYGISVDFTYKTDQQGGIINKLFGNLKKRINDVMKASFKKMTNFKTNKADATGHNFFNYIRALLILYVMIYGFMFLLGAVKISQYDLVVRVVKIAIVAGLLNGQTYEFFNQYVFGFVTGFCDQILSSLSGDNLFSGDKEASNPMIFLENIMRRIFGETFAVQSFALFSKGIFGIVYYFIIMLSVIILVINVIKAIAVYILSYLALALLLGILAPLFLSFLLFETTKEIAHNLIKVSIYYMLEPVILIIGQIVFCQMFTIYLDNVLSYSVCWKCAFPFRLPFLSLLSGKANILAENTIGILDLPVFCIPWYVPWGYDPITDENSLVSMTDCTVLLILAFGMHGYTNLARAITQRLTGAHAPSMISQGSDAVDSGIKKLDAAGREAGETIKDIASDDSVGDLAKKSKDFITHTRDKPMFSTRNK